MKAYSKASKRAAHRAGRKLLPNLERTPEGRISRNDEQNDKRSKSEETETLAVVLDMRKRHGATEANCRDQAWGYVLGRIYLDGNLGPGELGKQRLEAGNRYSEDMARYYGLTGIPFPSPRAHTLFSIRGHDGEVSQERADKARAASNHMMSLEGVLLKAGRNVATTVKNVCLHDIEEARLWPTHMFAYLRKGLDELALKYGLQDSRKSDRG